MAPVLTLFIRDKEEDKPKNDAWSTAAIVALVIFCVFAISMITLTTLYFIRRRKQHRSLPPEKRPTSYHPFRTQSSDKAALLENGAPSPEEDKSSMFSRDRNSSLSLYVDEAPQQQRRTSMENVNLIPLTVTPAERTQSMTASISNGSGVSNGSSQYSRATSGSLAISPISIPEDAADASRPSRPRSTSTTSQRYYEVNTTNPAPQVPKIVHTLSE